MQPQYPQDQTKTKSLPLILFNDHIYENEQVRRLRSDEGLYNPLTGIPDTTVKQIVPYLVPTAIKVLQRMMERNSEPIVVISVCGLKRCGKSLLSNLLIGDETLQVFELGHSQNTVTKGIWMANKLATGKHGKILVLDTEGFDDTDDSISVQKDRTIFALLYFLSSLIIYNSRNVPKREDLENFRFLANFQQRIKVSDDTKGPLPPMSLYGPSFLWVLRDCTLQVPHGYSDLTDFMCRYILKESNQVHSFIKIFKELKFECLGLPSVDVVTNLTQMGSQFLQQLGRLVPKIKNEAEVKVIPDPTSISHVQKITYFELMNLLDYAIYQINQETDVLANYTDAFKLMMERREQYAVKKALDVYIDILKRYIEPLNVQDLAKCEMDARRSAFEEYKKHINEDKPAEMLIANIEKEKEEFEKFQTAISMEFNGQLILKLYKLIVTPSIEQAKAPNGKFAQVEQAIEYFNSQYLSQGRGLAKTQVLGEFLDDHVKKDLDMLGSIEQFKEKVSTLRDQLRRDTEEVKKQAERLKSKTEEYAKNNNAMELFEMQKKIMEKITTDMQSARMEASKMRQEVFQTMSASMQEARKNNLDSMTRMFEIEQNGMSQRMNFITLANQQNQKAMTDCLTITTDAVKHYNATKKPSLGETLLTCGVSAVASFVSPYLAVATPILGQFAQNVAKSGFNALQQQGLMSEKVNVGMTPQAQTKPTSANNKQENK